MALSVGVAPGGGQGAIGPSNPAWTATELIPLLTGRKTICCFGDSGDGKTALLGELAEHLYRFGRSPAGKPLRTRLYTADEGGIDTILPYVSLGVIEVVELGRLPQPWLWLNAVVRGKVLDARGAWVDGLAEDIGCYAFEGMTSFGNLLRAAIGGTNDNAGSKPVASDKDAHGRSYGQAQDRMAAEIRESFNLPGVKYWTARALRGEDNDTTATILGPQIVGKALTSEVPAWFNYTFRVMGLPADEITKQPERHRLFLGDHTDQLARGAKGLGNNRRPLDGGDIPSYIEPASIVRALALINESAGVATNSIRARLSQQLNKR